MIDRAIQFVFRRNLPPFGLILVVLFLAILAKTLSRSVGLNLLRGDGQSTSVDWAKSVSTAVNELPAMLGGAKPSPDAMQQLAWASQMGDVYQFRIWDHSGRFVGGFARGKPIPPPALDTQVLTSIRSNRIITELHQASQPGGPAFFCVSFIPVRQDGQVIGTFEVFLDQTSDHHLFEGSLRVTEFTIFVAVLLAGGFPCIVVYRKTLQQRTSQAEIRFLNEYDSLTGIPNRHSLEGRANCVFPAANQGAGPIAVLLIDLDLFKDINDSFGHRVGDLILKEFARRVQSLIRSEDAFARFGGDEFIILQVGSSQPGGAAALAERLTKAFEEPYVVAGVKIICGASIGVAIAPDDADSWDELLACADAALYRAKAQGRNAVHFFHSQSDSMLLQRTLMENDLRRALDSNSLALEYQPCFRLGDESLIGFEALLRWPDRGMSPAEFIPLAEESGLIVPIGAWALKEACTVASSWPAPLKVAVNISPVQFRQGGIVETVASALAESGLDPSCLELEVTESLLLRDSEAVSRQLIELRSLGVSIALDDFGTGYSSLSYLWKFPFNAVKIDRVFVMEMGSNPKAVAVVETIAALGKALSLSVTAEGVEKHSQAHALLELGCDHAQGFLFGRPMQLARANEIVAMFTTETDNRISA